MTEAEGRGQGHGVSKPGGNKLSGILDTLRGQDNKIKNSSEDRLAGVTPSKKLPSTGLKRNTQEWKDEHPDEKGDKGKKTRSRASSSSSIPSNYGGSDDGRTEEQRREGQEGPRGRGAGQHEKEIGSNGHTGKEVMESPISEYSGHSLHQDHTPAAATAPGPPNGQTTETHSKSEGEEEEVSESFEGRDGKRERKLTDEAGRRPTGLPAVKKEEAPGPRNEIVLDPRISHMHVSQ